MRRDRDAMSGLRQDLTEKMGELTSHQARTYDLLGNLDARQNQLSNQQQQLIAILKKLTNDPSPQRLNFLSSSELII